MTFPAPIEGEQFKIDQYEEHWARMLALEPLVDEYNRLKARFKELAGEADVLTLHGVPVKTNKADGKLNMTRLKAEQPHLVAQYFKKEWREVEVFDQDAFAATHPDTFARYRTRSLRNPKKEQ